MRRILRAVLLLVLGQALLGGAAETTKIRIGVEGAYPPFSVVAPDGSLKGFDIDIAKALCAQMNVECSLVQQDFDGMIPALQARKFDAIIASMSITDERKKSVAFSDKYYNSPSRLVVKKGTRVRIKLVNNVPSEPNHGFAIPAYGVAEIVNRGEPKQVEFTADRDGIFPMICQLHPAHVGGQLVVLPEPSGGTSLTPQGPRR